MNRRDISSSRSIEHRGLDRRAFISATAMAAAQASIFNFGARAWAQQGSRVVAEEPWGRIEKLSAGVWAVVSTPLAARDFTTICNGGILAGEDRVLVVESFGSPEGARWVSGQAKTLTGREPTDVVITHYHGDHANGIEGFHATDQAPRIWRTAKTLELIEEADRARDDEVDEVRKQMLQEGPTIASGDVTTLDLGDREVRIHPRIGHTPSDVTIEIDDPAISFCGDLVWSGFFPNYRDTIPSEFAKSLRDLRRDDTTLYVSGHGEVADLATVDMLIEIVDSIGEVARRGHAKGIPAADAAAQFELPREAESWVLFNPSYFEVAMNAWYRELG